MVTSLPKLQIEQEDVCRGSTLGKKAKGSFSSSDSKSKGILNLIHSDVCGSMSAVSMQRALYYLTFIDDFSRKTWILFMKTKDEVFSWFQKFKARVENLTGNKIKVLRSNNGGKTPQMTSRISARSQGSRRRRRLTAKWGC